MWKWSDSLAVEVDVVERSIAESSPDSGAFSLHLPICMEELLMGL